MSADLQPPLNCPGFTKQLQDALKGIDDEDTPSFFHLPFQLRERIYQEIFAQRISTNLLLTNKRVNSEFKAVTEQTQEIIQLDLSRRACHKDGPLQHLRQLITRRLRTGKPFIRLQLNIINLYSASLWSLAIIPFLSSPHGCAAFGRLRVVFRVVDSPSDRDEARHLCRLMELGREWAEARGGQRRTTEEFREKLWEELMEQRDAHVGWPYVAARMENWNDIAQYEMYKSLEKVGHEKKKR